MCRARRPHHRTGCFAHRTLAAAGQSSRRHSFLPDRRPGRHRHGCAGPVLRYGLWPSDARKIAQGNLEHRAEWSSRDSFGAIAAELNRMAVRLRELRESEAGRRQMEFQLSDAVLQSIFEPIIVTDGKGHLLKVNPAAAELLGDAATDRMALANTPGGDKILSAIRDAVAMQKAGGRRRRSLHAAHAHRQAVAQLPAAHHAHARLGGPAAGHCDYPGRCNQPPGHRPLQDAVHRRGQPQAARSAAAVAARSLCPGPGLWRRRSCPCRRNWSTPPARNRRSSTTSWRTSSKSPRSTPASANSSWRTCAPRPCCAKPSDRYCDEAAQKRIQVEVSAYDDLVVGARRSPRGAFHPR